MLNRYFKYFLSLAFSFSLPLFADEIDEIYEKAVQTSPLVRAQHEAGLERRRQEAREIETVRQALIDHEKKEESLYEQVRGAFKQDALFFEHLNEALKLYKPGDEHGTTWQVKTQKMQLAIKGALEMSEKDFWAILDESTMPEGYAYTPPSINRFRNTDHIYASGRGIALKTLLWRTWGILNDTLLAAHMPLLGEGWLDCSPCAHITPLPKGFEMDGLTSSPYFYGDDTTPAGLVIFVNGYAFGGHRDETRYPEGKIWGPEDCSSWIARITKCHVPFSTVHQYLDYHTWTGFSAFRGRIDESVVKKWDTDVLGEWKKDPFRRPIEDALERYLVKDPQIDLKPGLIHGERGLGNFIQEDSSTHEITLYGRGGHTSLFLGILGSGSDTQALTLGFNRDIEETDRDGAYAVEPRLLWTPNPLENKRSIFYHQPIAVEW